MPRSMRKRSAIDTYHVIMRGSGKMIIFESDDDRLLFLRLLSRYLGELGGEVYAWTLMSDHVHLVLHMPLEDVATLMRRLGPSYCTAFNKRAGRTGHVLEDRFHSEPIDSDSYLMTCIRYVHQNIEKAGAGKMESYLWTSYSQYASPRSDGLPFVVERGLPLAVFGGLQSFLRFHEERNFAVSCIDVGKLPGGMTDEEALTVARSLLGEEEVRKLKETEPGERNERLRKLKEAGIPVRQIGRIAGIGRHVVARA